MRYEMELVAAQLGERMAKASARAMEIERDEARAERDRISESYVVDLDEARERADRLAAALREVLDVVQWMSGSNDFAPEGKAYAGWVRALPKLDAARALVPETPAANPNTSKDGE